MRVFLKPGILDGIQHDLHMTDQDFAEYIGVSRMQLWRAKLSPDDRRFSLGNEFIAKVLNRFNDKTFEDFFFLDSVSHVCYKDQPAATN